MPTGYVATPFDCFVSGYCVSHDTKSNSTWKIWLEIGLYHSDHSDCHIGDEAPVEDCGVV